MPEVACGGGGLFSGCRLLSWVYSAVLFPSVQLEIMDRFFSSHTDRCQMRFSAFEDQLSLNQVDLGFIFWKSLDRSGALDLAGGDVLGIFVATVVFSEHLDFIRMSELCCNNNS